MDYEKSPNEMKMFVLGRLSLDSKKLMRGFPPRFSQNKKAVFDIICPPEKIHKSVMEFAKYSAMPLKQSFQIRQPAGKEMEVVLNLGVYSYEPTVQVNGKPTLEWHVNFADPLLFGFYSTPTKFAQDETQVLEHPSLGSLRDYLEFGSSRNCHLAPFTVNRKSHDPTPCLVRNVERHGFFDTNPDSSEGRSRGLYLKNFCRAPVEAVKRATKIIDPPTISNIIAIAAPKNGRGTYTRSQIVNILTTAYTGFAAAKHETELWLNSATDVCEGPNDGRSFSVTIHTGNWGTGVFRGNLVLMSLLQLVAAEMAGIDRFVFYSAGNGDHFVEAQRILEEMRKKYDAKQSKTIAVDEFISYVEQLKFRWRDGSDGNSLGQMYNHTGQFTP